MVLNDSNRFHTGALESAAPGVGMKAHSKFDQEVFNTEVHAANLDISGVGSHAAGVLNGRGDSGICI